MPVRVVAARHEGCAAATRVRLPHTVPARAVRRVRCAQCSRDFEAEAVEDVPAHGSLLDRVDPSSLGWRFLSVPLAAAAVIAGLLIIQGSGDDPQPAPAEPEGSASAPAQAAQPAAQASAPSPPAGGGGGEDEAERRGGETASNDARAPRPDRQPQVQAEAADGALATLVEGSSFRLALPGGWEQVNPPSGATFMAVAPDGGADATLWIRRDPDLDFNQFVSDSTAQLEALAGTEPEVVERTLAPNVEDSVVRLAANPPPGQPSYEVTLRAAGEYRYHLAISVQPDASIAAAAGADLISESLAPTGGE